MKKTNHKTLVQILLSVLCLVTLQTRQLVLMSHYSMLFPIPCTRHYYNIQNVNIYQAATLLGSGMLQPHNENYQWQSTTAPPPKKTQKKTKTKTKKGRKATCLRPHTSALILLCPWAFYSYHHLWSQRPEITASVRFLFNLNKNILRQISHKILLQHV